MKTTLFLTVISTIASMAHGLALAQNKPLQPKTISQAQAQPPGYLLRSGPAVLRFGPPSAPPFISLPALPVTKNPQPTGEFPDSEPAPKQAGTTAGGQSVTQYVLVPPASTNLSTPAMLPYMIKYFPNGKPAGVEVFANPGIQFQPPVRRSSSAGYEVK